MLLQASAAGRTRGSGYVTGRLPRLAVRPPSTSMALGPASLQGGCAAASQHPKLLAGLKSCNAPICSKLPKTSVGWQSCLSVPAA
jgi:hypothetical protein